MLTGLMVLAAAQAQEEYLDVLVDDPYMCNGYFIKDLQKCQAAGVAQINVEIMGIRDVGGVPTKRLLQAITITDNLYGKVDPSKLAELMDGEQVYYQLSAFDNSGNTLVYYEGLPTGESYPSEWVCSTTCQATTWAWKIDANSISALGQTYLTIANASSPYGYYYFYVPLADWGWWHIDHEPSEFGLINDAYDGSWYGWAGYLEDVQQTMVIKLEPNLANGGGGAPDGAKSWLGYNILAHTPVVAIRKDRGAYRALGAFRQLDCAGCSGLCGNLMAYYNAGDEVQQDLAQENLPPLWCPAMPYQVDADDIVDMNSNNPFDACNNIEVLDGNLFNWMNAWMDCISNIGNGGGSGGGGGNGGGGFDETITYATVRINRWYDDGTMDGVFGVDIPDGKDPKLVQVDRTELTPGLYEFVVVLNNGQIMRHFEDFDQPQIINADFADFITVNIYPVPVKDREFAIDLELMAPGQVDITIVNNMGEPYYAKQLNIEAAGRHKHVVRMDPEWPNGIYHAIFQYGDGSSTSRNFSVE